MVEIHGKEPATHHAFHVAERVERDNLNHLYDFVPADTGDFNQAETGMNARRIQRQGIP